MIGPYGPAAAFLGCACARTVDEDAPHGLRASGEQCATEILCLRTGNGNAPKQLEQHVIGERMSWRTSSPSNKCGDILENLVPMSAPQRAQFSPRIGSGSQGGFDILNACGNAE
jgi:hypothetical protein